MTCSDYYEKCYKWINRRSQKKSMTWEQFVHYVEVNPLPKPKIHFSLYA
ncbi:MULTISPECIES: hypothetical protein [unclassified Wolbachia]|nr:hypothetical protein [Wolbachia endosymbiont (group A) of Sphecodes monilicornis]